MNRIINYFRSVKEEFKKVVWPTRHQAAIHTVTVLTVIIIATILVTLIDYGFTTLFKQTILK